MVYWATLNIVSGTTLTKTLSPDLDIGPDDRVDTNFISG